MVVKKRALGRGLEALIPGKPTAQATPPPPPPSVAAIGPASRVSIDRIDPNPEQPRQFFDDERLAELAASIRVHGVIQPLLLKSVNGRYQIVAGERRYRAAKLAGLTDLPAVVEEVTEQNQLEIALIENLQREDLNPMEEARAFQQLISRYGLSQEGVADRVGKARATVANGLRLLKLPVSMQHDLEAGRLTAGHARALLSLSNFPNKQDRLYKAILADDLSVREAEQMARRLLQPSQPTIKLLPTEDPQARALEEKLTETLGVQAKVKPISPTKGRIEIHYASLDDLDRVLVHLGVDADAM